MFSSFLVVACDDNSIQSVGGPVSDGQNSVQTNSGLSASFSGDASINCDDVEPQDKITVTGTHLAPFYWIPGGGFGGFVSGATGGGVSTMPNNPNNNEETADCSAVPSVRMNHARSDIALRLTTLRVGQVVEVEYDNGQSELFIIDCRVCTITGVPVPGSCGG